MTETGAESDMSIGLGVLFGTLALAGAAVMYLGVENQLYAGTGFAVAVLAGGLAIAGLHLYD